VTEIVRDFLQVLQLSFAVEEELPTPIEAQGEQQGRLQARRRIDQELIAAGQKAGLGGRLFHKTIEQCDLAQKTERHENEADDSVERGRKMAGLALQNRFNKKAARLFFR
jgi:hypothetical protein